MKNHENHEKPTWHHEKPWKTMKNQPGIIKTMKNHEKPTWNHKTHEKL